MPDAQRVALLIRQPADVWEGLRSALGLMVENLVADCYLIGAPVQLPAGKDRFDFQDNLDLLAELEGQCFTNFAGDSQAYEFMTYASLEQMAERLGQYQLLIPF